MKQSLLYIALATAALTACGGGGTSETPDPLPMSGTAAVGAALSGATVTVRDTRGGILGAQTDTQGNYAVNGMATGALMVRCSGGTAGGAANAKLLHGLSLDGRTVNCTPLTELLLWKLLGRSPAVAFETFNHGDVAALNAAAVAAAETAVLAALGEGAGVDIDPAAVPKAWAATRLVAGDVKDAHDLALEALRETIPTQVELNLMGEIALKGVCAADGTCS